MSIKYLFPYIVIGTSKLLEWPLPNLKIERRTLQEILANVCDCLLLISFSEGLDYSYHLFRRYAENFHLPTLRRFFDEVFGGGKKTSRQSKWFYGQCWMVDAESTDKTALSALCGHQLMVELKCNVKNEIEDHV